MSQNVDKIRGRLVGDSAVLIRDWSTDEPPEMPPPQMPPPQMPPPQMPPPQMPPPQMPPPQMPPPQMPPPQMPPPQMPNAHEEVPIVLAHEEVPIVLAHEEVPIVLGSDSDEDGPPLLDSDPELGGNGDSGAPLLDPEDPEAAAVHQLLLDMEEQENLVPDELPSAYSAANLGYGVIAVPVFSVGFNEPTIQLSLSATNLLDCDNTSKSDPMVVVYVKKGDGKLEELGRTEVILNSLNPAWIEKITVSYHFEVVQPLIFHVYHVDTNYHNANVKTLNLKDQDFIGEGSCVLSEILTKQSRSLSLNLHSKNGRGGLRTLTVHAQENRDQFCEKEQFNFLDYICSGFELNFMVAVDFTASNGNSQQHDSLHYIDPYGRLNSYQQAITEVGEVIQFYDADKRFPAWGFGGRTAGGPVSHCFNLDGTATGFEVEGVQGIMAAYASALHDVSLSGPTLFGQVVNRAAEIADNSLFHNNNKYYVLLIITDGIPADLQETKDALVRASDLPLSVLIVGVGSADFKQMEILDADNGQRLASSTGRVATRDIVQFVPLREVQSGCISVVQSLLKELPGQFLSYMHCRDIKPPQPSY